MCADMDQAVIFLLVLSLFLGNVTAALENTTTESVSDDAGITVSLWNHSENDAFKQRINLAPFNHLNITVTDIPSEIWFIILQIHTFQYNATLCYDEALFDKVSNRSLFGSNIGLYLKTHNVTAPIQVFLKHDNVHNLDALLVIVTYGRNAPTPGSCNMEFDIEVSPYQKLLAENDMIVVDTEPASILGPDGSPIPCEKSVQHKMYRLYLPRQDFTPDTYFDAIASMLTAQDIARNGDEIPVGALTDSMRRVYSAYAGTGSVYAAVATYENYSSAYVPIFTYACSPLLHPESCQVLNDTFAGIVCALVLITGCLSTIIGHKCAFIDGLLASSMTGGVFGYIIATYTDDHRTIAIKILIGLAFAVLVTPAISILLSACKRISGVLRNMSLGFLCACIAYLYAPAWMFYVLEHNWLFWPVFAILTLAITTLLMPMSDAAEVITRAIFGSYFVIVALDYYIGSNLKYIIVTIIRRMTIPGFHLAFVYPPLQSADVTLLIIWSVLIIARFIIQQCISSWCKGMPTIKIVMFNKDGVSLLANYRRSSIVAGSSKRSLMRLPKRDHVIRIHD
ncbi:PREDICTED: transmembrane 7 superfamily member 3-like [Wasmannia auropunctata]|uniref:transmembrane 7 superfamily member 3-like n=1 Tax=Wasmannia auropunctata TaxID=64793 RepID=UPI0005EFDB84|nr:PREDICTED: transmembrane 7 superfamily member 3-like [Wasmannia auropunctata]